MVRGNWQKRVEMAAARRHESQQRKQYLEQQRLWKSQLQQFWKRLELLLTPTTNNNNSSTTLPLKVHIWFDTTTTPTKNKTDALVSTNQSDVAVSISKHKNNNNNMVEEATKKKSHPRSKTTSTTSPSSNSHHQYATRGKGSVKKASKESMIITTRDDSTKDRSGTTTRTGNSCMCRSYFYTGHCSNLSMGGLQSRRNKHTCPSIHGCCGCTYGNHDDDHDQVQKTHIHINPKVTLWNVLVGIEQPQPQQVQQSLREELQLCQNAELSSNQDISMTDDNAVTMELLQYLEVNVSQQTTMTASSSFSILQRTCMNAVSYHTTSSSPWASIVYIVFDDILVYDRYRQNGDGLLDPSDHNQTFMTKLQPVIEYQNFTETELYQILQYLPETMVPTMELVCRNWYHQIRMSSMIWEDMLQRRNWSSPPQQQLQHHHHHKQQADLELMMNMDKIDNDCTILRDTYCQHYTMICDIQALTNYRYSEVEDDPINQCSILYNNEDYIDVKPWSKNCILALSDSFILFLYETKSEERKINEIISISLEFLLPEHLRLLSMSMDLDEQYIYVSFGQYDDVASQCCYLATIKKDDFVVKYHDHDYSPYKGIPNTCSVDDWNIIDIYEIVMSYILKCNDESDPVISFIRDRGTKDDLLFSTFYRPSVLLCGRDQVLLRIVMTTKDMEYIDYLSWKLLLFSVSMNTIVWSLECDKFPKVSSSRSYRSIECFCCSSTNDDAQPTRRFTVWDESSDTILTGSVYTGGKVTCVYSSIQNPISPTLDWDQETNPLVELPAWNLDYTTNYLVVAPTDIVITRTCVNKQHTLICFYPIDSDDAISNVCAVVPLLGYPAIINKPSIVRDNYIVLFCRSRPEGGVMIVTYYIPDRTEIYRGECLNWSSSMHSTRPFSIEYCMPSVCHDTITFWQNNPGDNMTMTSFDLRKSLQSKVNKQRKDAEQKSSLKRPGGKSNRKNKKKDAFARGSHRM